MDNNQKTNGHTLEIKIDGTVIGTGKIVQIGAIEDTKDVYEVTYVRPGKTPKTVKFTFTLEHPYTHEGILRAMHEELFEKMGK